MLKRVEQGEPLRRIARDYSVSYEAIRRVLRGRVSVQWDVSAQISRNRQFSTQRLQKQSTDEASPTRVPGASGTAVVYHSRVQHTREAPGLQTGARREANMPHEVPNCPLDHDKDVQRVFFQVLERLLQVE